MPSNCPLTRSSAKSSPKQSELKNKYWTQLWQGAKNGSPGSREGKARHYDEQLTTMCLPQSGGGVA